MLWTEEVEEFLKPRSWFESFAWHATVKFGIMWTFEQIDLNHVLFYFQFTNFFHDNVEVHRLHYCLNRRIEKGCQTDTQSGNKKLHGFNNLGFESLRCIKTNKIHVWLKEKQYNGRELSRHWCSLITFLVSNICHMFIKPSKTFHTSQKKDRISSWMLADGV